MYLLSRYAGWGRNFWIRVDDGPLDIYTNGEHLRVIVKDGIVVEQTSQRKNEYITLKYGQGCERGKANMVLQEEYFQPGTLQAIRKGTLWRRLKGLSLCGAEGMVECFSTTSGAYGKEIFTYNNGNIGYIAAIWRKKLQVRRPDGSLWILVKGGKVSLNRQPLADRLRPDNTDPGLWRIMKPGNWQVTIYYQSGKVITQGKVENNQKQGKWLEDGKVFYYLSGVKVSRQLYEGDVDKWDAYEVLRIPNAQLRCSLLNKMGYDKLLAKVKHKVIEKSNDGGQLLQIDTGLDGRSTRGLDRTIRLIKVICPSTKQLYVLRVPPNIETYQQARQWTFGLREQSIKQGAYLELVKET